MCCKNVLQKRYFTLQKPKKILALAYSTCIVNCDTLFLLIRTVMAYIIYQKMRLFTPKVGSSSKALEHFWLFCILNSSKHHSSGSAITNSDESLHHKSTLLRVWRSEFGILNQYTGFKIAMALQPGSQTIAIHIAQYLEM